MHIIIYLASQDIVARNNYARLIDYRRDPERQRPNDETFAFTHVDLVGEQLQNHNKDLFRSIPIEQKDNVTVELVGHGLDNNPLVLLNLPVEEGVNANDYIITPKILANFFIANASNGTEYKFKNLTLFCCRSLEFGKELSKEMHNMKITCFEEDIKIDGTRGVAVNTNFQDVSPHIFLNGTDITYEATVNDDAFSEFIIQTSSTSSSSSSGLFADSAVSRSSSRTSERNLTPVTEAKPNISSSRK